MSSGRARIGTSVAVVVALTLAACPGGLDGPAARPGRSPIPVEIESPTPVAPDEGRDEPRVPQADVDAYAADVCRGVHGWVEATTAAAGRVARRTRDGSLADTKVAIVVWAERLVEVTDALISYLRGTEPPPSRGAQRGHEFLLVAFDGARDVFVRRRARARALPVSGLEAFEVDASELGRRVILVRERIGRLFARAPYDRRTVVAFGRVVACAPLDDDLGADDTTKV